MLVRPYLGVDVELVRGEEVVPKEQHQLRAMLEVFFLEPEMSVRGDQVPPKYATTPLLQDTLLRVLSVVEGFTQGGNATGTLQGSQTRARVKT